MTRVRFALVAAVSAVVLGLSASAGAAGTSGDSGTVTTGIAGAGTAACLAHVVGGLSEDWYDNYTPGCTGHDEPELDPVSSASRSAQNITWHVQLPADDGQGHEPAQDRPGGVPGAAVLPRLVHEELLLERWLLRQARAERLHGVLAGLDDRAPGKADRRAGSVQRHAHGRHG